MEIVMPKMGESVSEGTIIKWHKKEGDKVERDEIIFEISTDKVDTEIPSPADGVLQQIKVPEGDTVEVGTVVAIISENGESSGTAAGEMEAPRKVEVTEDKSETKKEEEKEIRKEAERMQPEVKESSTPAAEDQGEIIDIAMPKMGESVMEGTILKWHKKVGEKVEKDETIFEISTDKVDTEVPSPADGTMAEILVAEQETVEVGTIVAKLSTGKGAPARLKKEEKPAVAKAEKPAVEKAASKEPEASAQQKKETPQQMHEAFSAGTIKRAESNEGENSGFYSPLVLNIARKENVSFDELARIRGTGLENRLTKKDIIAYVESRGEAKPAASKPESAPASKDVRPGEKEKTKLAPQAQPSFTGQVTGDIERIPMDNIRQKIMQHMVNSRDTSVHVTTMLEVDMTRIYNFIQKNKEEYLQKEGVKLTYMAFIANASVKALKEFPLVNSTIDGTTILQKRFINLGIAVAVEPTGLIVPNIKSADERNITGLAKAINDVAVRARNKKLTPDDITGGTFTITNYGVFGAIFGTPIINQPEVAILGVGTVAKKPVVIEVDGSDTIAIKPVMALTLAHDHRLIDGMLGGKFLKYVKDTLESFNPSTM